jgi:hypothetical protein
MKNWLMDAKNRRHLYMVSLAVIPLLVFYGVIAQEAAPLWIAIVGAIVAPSVALNHITPNDADVASAPEDFDEKDF